MDVHQRPTTPMMHLSAFLPSEGGMQVTLKMAEAPIGSVLFVESYGLSVAERRLPFLEASLPMLEPLRRARGSYPRPYWARCCLPCWAS